MLHRIAMRVLPSLTGPVTEDAFRRRKRIVMLFPGLGAFALYRILQGGGWHRDILVLLAVSGLFSAAVAVIAYALARRRRIVEGLRDEPLVTLSWVAWQIGFVYAVQLSLMVLGLLKIVSYSYTVHPDGSAMMALIIASTSVARDAFELGHLRSVQQGAFFPVLADERGPWTFLKSRPDLWGSPVAWTTVTVSLLYGLLGGTAAWIATDIGQLLVGGVFIGGAATVAYVSGLRPSAGIRQSMTAYSWRELLRFFAWPGLAFAWTYFLTVFGAATYLFDVSDLSLLWRTAVTGGTAGLMSTYCYYLGRCRWQEENLHGKLSPSMLRCPFILGVLTSTKV